MRRFRKAMLGLPSSFEEARATRQGIEARLRRVIARTERVAETAERDAMVREVAVTVNLRPDDLREARAIAEVAAAAGAPGTLEYWKSAPYLLSFMRGYKLRQRLAEQARTPSPRLRAAIRAARPFQLDRAAVDSYRPIAPNNGRMRALVETAFDGDMARRLWVPPSLPYFGSRIGPARRWSSRLGRWFPMPSPRSCRTRPSAAWEWETGATATSTHRPPARSSFARSKAGSPVCVP